MRLKITAAAVALSMIGLAAPAQATVTYQFVTFDSSFRFVSPDYQPSSGGHTEYCSSPRGYGACSPIYFLSGVNGSDFLRYEVAGNGTDRPNRVYAEYFQLGAFSAPGSYDSRFGALLIVTATDDTPATVPEPATWALMILGFGAVGAMARRRGVALG